MKQTMLTISSHHQLGFITLIDFIRLTSPAVEATRTDVYLSKKSPNIFEISKNEIWRLLVISLVTRALTCRPKFIISLPLDWLVKPFPNKLTFSAPVQVKINNKTSGRFSSALLTADRIGWKCRLNEGNRNKKDFTCPPAVSSLLPEINQAAWTGNVVNFFYLFRQFFNKNRNESQWNELRFRSKYFFIDLDSKYFWSLKSDNKCRRY